MARGERARSGSGGLPALNGADNGKGLQSLAEIQRARILAAMVEVCAERGVGNVTVAHVVGRSGVSRRTFYELFTSCKDCFHSVFDDGIDRVCDCVLPAYSARGHWLERIRAALIAFLSFLDDDPGTGRLLIVEMLGAGHEAQERRGRVLAQAIAAVDEGRAEAKKTPVLSTLTAEGVIGGALSVLHSRLLDPERRSLLELAGPLMGMIVLPYLGPAAARRELERPVPVPVAKPRAGPTNPLRDLDMRLTYRTIRVLMAVSAYPGASNREISFAAGIQDQGQTSKLLMRLSRLGLIENTPAGLARGAPNAWMLTAEGRAIEQAVGRDATS